MNLTDLGKLLLLVAALLAVTGGALLLLGRFPSFPLGRLPGDINVERGNWRVHLPIATSVVLSLVLSLILYFLGGRRR